MAATLVNYARGETAHIFDERILDIIGTYQLFEYIGLYSKFYASESYTGIELSDILVEMLLQIAQLGNPDEQKLHIDLLNHFGIYDYKFFVKHVLSKYVESKQNKISGLSLENIVAYAKIFGPDKSKVLLMRLTNLPSCSESCAEIPDKVTTDNSLFNCSAEEMVVASASQHHPQFVK